MPDPWNRTSRLERLLIVMGIGCNLFWVFRILGLNDLVRGRTCCDGLDYLAYAARFTSYQDALSLTARAPRLFGFPLYLYLHRRFAESLTPFVVLDWPNLALFTGVVIYVLAALLLLHALRPLRLTTQPLLAFLLLSFSPVVSSLSVHLTDSICTAFVIAIMALLVCNFRSKAPMRGLFRAAAIGSLIGAGISFRPSFQAVSLASLVGLGFFVGRYHGWKWASAQVVVAIVCAVAFLSPALIICYDRDRTACLLPPQYQHAEFASSMKLGLVTTRVYTSFTPQAHLEIVTDDFMNETYGGCTIGTDHPQMDFITCVARGGPVAAARLFLKKVVVLFDNPYLTAYGSEVTHPWEQIVFRFYSLLAFLGFAYGLWALRWRAIAAREPAVEDAILVCFAAVAWMHVCLHGMFHTEARYGFLAAPPALVLVAVLFRNAGQSSRWRGAAFVVGVATAAAVFFHQVGTWDDSDPGEKKVIANGQHAD